MLRESWRCSSTLDLLTSAIEKTDSFVMLQKGSRGLLVLLARLALLALRASLVLLECQVKHFMDA